MTPMICMPTVASQSRVAWAREGGARRRYRTLWVERALRRRQKAGWVAAVAADGPRHERLTMLHASHPLAPVACQYAAGVRWWERKGLENALGARLDTGAGADRLAAAGFGIVGVNGPLVEFRAADSRVARLVNRSRLGDQLRGYDARRVISSLLSLPPKSRRRRRLTDDRRLDAAWLLQEQWRIDCDDLLDFRPMVRLHSQWTYSSVGNEPLTSHPYLLTN